MKFTKLYKQLKPSIVAISSKVSRNQYLPDIIGTGFIVRSDGIIFTNDHIVRKLNKLPKLKDDTEKDWPAMVLLFYQIEKKGMAIIPLSIKGVGILEYKDDIDRTKYPPDLPDLGFIHINAKNLPILKLAPTFKLEEGEEVLISGFPMGSDTLIAPGWFHQASQTLQSGIISSILPFPCDNPNSILIDVMIEGGSSGSPVFNPRNGEVIGIAYGGLSDQIAKIKSDKKILTLSQNTSHTLAIPSNILTGILRKINLEHENEDNVVDFQKLIKELPDDLSVSFMKKSEPGDIIFRTKDML